MLCVTKFKISPGPDIDFPWHANSCLVYTASRKCSEQVVQQVQNCKPGKRTQTYHSGISSFFTQTRCSQYGLHKHLIKNSASTPSAYADFSKNKTHVFTYFPEVYP